MKLYSDEKKHRKEELKRKSNKEKRIKNGKIAMKRSNQLRVNATKAEKILLEALVKEGIDFKFQKCFFTSSLIYIVDFYFENIFGKKYVIEIDGPAHKHNKEYDRKRSFFLYGARNCCVKRFTNAEVISDVDRGVEKVCSLSPKEYSPPAKIIPEGLKGDGTYKKEEYGYRIGRTSHKFKKYRNLKMSKRI